MYFNSYTFILFFMPVVVLGYCFVLRTGKPDVIKLWVLLASCAFYCINDPAGFVALTPLVVINTLAARKFIQIGKRSDSKRKLLIYAAIVLNISWLAYFKYTNFVIGTVNEVFGSQYPSRNVILPLGISFLVFQNIQFLLDILSGELKSFRLLDFLVFSSFFPRAVAGPIAKYREIMPGLSAVNRSTVPSNIVLGVILFSIGLFKKCFIADGLGTYVSETFDSQLPPEGLSLIDAWIGALACTLQIYFDFSGYSDMAIGTARLLGVKLPTNFNSPLKARNIIEFWNRWHITLTRFLTWNVYVPCVRSITQWRLNRNLPVLAGDQSRTPAIATLVAWPTMATMVISGLWHGAGWQFVFWGSIHGVLLTLNQAYRLLRPRKSSQEYILSGVMSVISTAVTFNLVVIAMVFFRAESVSAAVDIVKGMMGFHNVLPFVAHVAYAVGRPLPFAFWEGIVPMYPFLWIVGVLLPGVFLLPNSMEILGRIEISISKGTYAADGRQPSHRRVAPERSEVQQARSWNFRLSWLRTTLFSDESAIHLRIAALGAALLFVLGVMAIGREVPFLYGKF